VRVTRKQAEANREKVLDVAGTLFRERGFEGIGVADIMKASTASSRRKTTSSPRPQSECSRTQGGRNG
jgi:hypothetical protein